MSQLKDVGPGARIESEGTQAGAPRAERADLLVLCLGHSVTDIYSNYLPGLLVFLTVPLGLTNTLVGVLATIVSLSGSMSQILFGLLADRVKQHYFLVIGPAAAAIFMSCLGRAHSVPALITLLVLGGLSVACFHPQGSVAAGAGHGKSRGFDLALFVTAGSAGYSLGPIVATWAAQRFGLERMWLGALPGLLTGLALYATVYRHLHQGDERRVTGDEGRETGDAAGSAATTGNPQGVGSGGAGGGSTLPASSAERDPGLVPRHPSLVPVRTALLLLWAVVTLRSAVSIGLVHFLPLFLKDRGASPVYGSLSVSLFLFSGAVGGMVGGALSDRWGRRRVLISSLAVSAPLLGALPWVPAAGFLPLLAAAGFVLSASSAVNVAMAQEIAPERQGTASAMVQGFAFGTGGLLAVAAGALADRTSIAVVCQALAVVPLLAAPVGLMLPETVRKMKAPAR